MPFQPALDFRGLVRPVVIQHQVQFLVPGKVPVQAAQEPQEFLMAMPATALSDDFAVQYIERGEERGGSVPLVVVCHRAAPPFFQGQARLGAVQGLDLALFIHAQQDRKSTRLNSSHTVISYAVFCLKKKKKQTVRTIPNPSDSDFV